MSSSGLSCIRYRVHAVDGSDVSSEHDSNEGYEDSAEALQSQQASQTSQITSSSTLDGNDTSGSNENYDATYRIHRLGNSNDRNKVNKSKNSAKRKANHSESKARDCTAQRKKGRFDLTNNKPMESMHPLGWVPESMPMLLLVKT
jgi:hypothetical protein